MLGPNTPELKNVLNRVSGSDKQFVIQKYVCNEMTFQGRKFDFRVYWIVVSLDPLIVMFYPAFLRMGTAKYSESDFSDTAKHLTTGVFQARETKGKWSAFEDAVLEHGKKFGIRDPVNHVKNQAKQAVGEMVKAFKDTALVPGIKEYPAQNGFGMFGKRTFTSHCCCCCYQCAHDFD